MDQTESEQFRAQLLALKQDILDTSSIRDEISATVSLDQSCTGRLSRMDALQTQAIAVAGKTRADKQLRLIEAAIVRIDHDDFGFCMECGEPINPRRLEIDPTSLYCITCAQ
ncbi:TraR/DksA family transcriptional regulator [Marinobacter salicampi]|uniref:TraR/DksA family transcriptional regulator n=1 Tax=Marinobacter salicampi TaxID=435907 RepID=UPI00140E6258|nr:TraR/DksA family transcriptional regulator [Marinobacter salicampi]